MQPIEETIQRVIIQDFDLLNNYKTCNLIEAHKNNLLQSHKNKILKPLDGFSYCADEDADHLADYYGALEEGDFVKACYLAKQYDEIEELLLSAIENNDEELAITLLLLGANINHQYVGEYDDINYPITLAMANGLEYVFNALLLFHDINLAVIGTPIMENPEVRQFCGYPVTNSALCPLAVLLQAEYQNFARFINVDFDVILSDNSMLNTLLIEQNLIYELKQLIVLGGYADDVDGDDCGYIGSLYWDYKSKPIDTNLNRISEFGNIISNVLIQGDEPWLIDLIDNCGKPYAKSLIKELGIEELITQLADKYEAQQSKIDELEDELADAVSDSDFFKRLDLTSIVNNHNKFIEIDITEEFIELNFNFVKPYVKAIKVRQQNAEYELVLEINTGIELTEEIKISGFFNRPFQSSVKMTAYVYQHLIRLKNVYISLLASHKATLEPLNKLTPNFIDALLNHDVVIEGCHSFDLFKYLAMLCNTDSVDFFNSVNKVNKSQYIQVIVDKKVEVNLIDFRESLPIYSGEIGPENKDEYKVLNIALYQAILMLSRTQIYDKHDK
ncbi:hypothetical protein [Pseudoalteromonas sp. H103]|uniref:hypothetical protein n=1 Tax=Pseudoalteromonas sp. H103 TaxID=1761893 RepID=UPI0007322F79|nr:hypothetical protein [Pseudoalteromonas sp. H103]KTF11890.1 hypothetical protein ATS74_06820 [Pseudoalteromonas sp. H103]